MGRIYTVSYSQASIAAAQDLLQITSQSTKVTILHALEISQENSTVQQMLRVTIQRAGSAGSTVNTFTPRPANPSDTAYGGTTVGNDTSRATSLTALYSAAFASLNGWQYWPSPDDRIVIAPSAILIIGLESAPSPTLTIDFSAVIEELG